MKGMCSNCKVTLTDLLGSSELIERSPDSIIPSYTILEDGCSLNIVKREQLVSSIIRVVPRKPLPWIPHSDPTFSELEDLRSLYFHSIYTDGSRAVNHTYSSFLLGTSRVTTAGAIVLHTNRGLFPIKVEMDIESTSAYDPELVSLLIAQEIAGDRLVTAWSDCSAAIKCVISGNLGRYAQVLSGWKRNRNIKICKVDAHPEHRKVPNEWTVEEKGNFIADRVAGGAVEARLTIKASKWLRFIESRSKIIVTDQDGLPVITDPRVIKSRTDRKQYLHPRDHYREKDLKPPCWEGLTWLYIID